MNKFICLVIVMTLISGCTQSGQSSDKPFADTDWNLAELSGKNIQQTLTQVPYLTFEAERVNGNDGCNNFFGGYTRDGDKLEFGMLASTRMACPHIDALDIEFNKALSATTNFRINGNRLDLYADEELLASFLAAEQE